MTPTATPTIVVATETPPPPDPKAPGMGYWLISMLISWGCATGIYQWGEILHQVGFTLGAAGNCGWYVLPTSSYPWGSRFICLAGGIRNSRNPGDHHCRSTGRMAAGRLVVYGCPAGCSENLILTCQRNHQCNQAYPNG
jgi:hypothetical protein